jgi:site-specific DNA recombinase
VTGGKHVRNRFGALLKGLLRCMPCGCGMVHSHTTKSGNRRYRYYICQNAQSRGWQSCPSPSVPAREIERFVVDQVKCIGRDTNLLTETLEQCRHQREESIRGLESEKLALERELRRWMRVAAARLQGWPEWRAAIDGRCPGPSFASSAAGDRSARSIIRRARTC